MSSIRETRSAISALGIAPPDAQLLLRASADQRLSLKDALSRTDRRGVAQALQAIIATANQTASPRPADRTLDAPLEPNLSSSDEPFPPSEPSLASRPVPTSALLTPFKTVKVFGGKGALTFDLRKFEDGEHVLLEAAAATAPRVYDWNAKITLRLSIDELVGVLAVLMGLIATTEGKHHGPANNKGFAVARQDQVVYWRVTEGERLVGVPMPYTQCTHVASLVVARLRDGLYGCDSVGDVLALVRETVQAPQERRRG